MSSWEHRSMGQGAEKDPRDPFTKPELMKTELGSGFSMSVQTCAKYILNDHSLLTYKHNGKQRGLLPVITSYDLVST